MGSFHGLWTDPVTGISYARARWYDARNAAWLSEDPMVDVDSPNLYAFVAWSPAMGIDPLGLVRFRDRWEFFKGYAVGVAKVVASPGILTYNLVGSAAYDITGNPIYRKQKEASVRLATAIVEATQSGEKAAAVVIEGVTAGADQLVDAVERGDYYGAGEGTGNIVGQFALVAETVQGTTIKVAPATALTMSTGDILSFGATVTIEMTPRAQWAGLSLMADVGNKGSDGGSNKGRKRGASRAEDDPNLRELPEGSTRTTKDNAAARRFYKSNRQEAMRRWEERTGQSWPTDPETGRPQWAEHPRALKEGGDPLYVEPGVGPDPNAPHMRPGPDGLTDHQRWGRLGPPARARGGSQ